ncbi:MAG: MBL fold metallo-hydrolase [Chloroflexota bacterium]|nr:MBL fold metallo-hydrolase [Chloroflexota bacterium]
MLGSPQARSAPSERVTLTPVDAVDVTVLVENSIDNFLVDDAFAKRPAWKRELLPDVLRAEHGLALQLTVHQNGSSQSILYDAGNGRDTAVYNMDVLSLQIKDLRAVVVSHGHPDHMGGMEGLLRRVGRQGMPLILHPDAWKERKLVFPSGFETYLPQPSPQDLGREGVEIVEERGPSMLIDGSVLVTGEIARTTDFENGFPLQYARGERGWEPDFMCWDEQAVVVHVRGKGLVVLAGCSHPGIINIIKHAQHVTGVDQVHAVIGGFHLTGGIFEPIIPRTLDELAALAPAAIVPGHCTGWKAIHAIARRMPEAYVQTSVGTRLEFRSA